MAVQLLKKWGNSPAVRIPASVMKAAHLTLDQLVEIRVQNGMAGPLLRTPLCRSK